MRISDWSSDVCSSDLCRAVHVIVAEDDDALARLDRGGDTAGGCVHVVKDRRVRHTCADRRRAVPLQVVIRAPAWKIELGFVPGKPTAIRARTSVCEG